MSREKSDIWIPMYIGDIMGDTQTFTDEQFGKYHKIIYTSGGKDIFPPGTSVVLVSMPEHSPSSALAQLGITGIGMPNRNEFRG